AFAALKSDGSVVTWGYSSYGGDSSGVSSRLTSGVTQIFSTRTAFAALKSDGSVVTWGDSSNGGDSSSVSSRLSSGVVSFADPFNDDRLVPGTSTTQPSITLAVSPTSVTEDGTANLVYTFTRSGDTTFSLTVNYTVGGTATNGVDYATIPTSVTFAAGSSTATLTVDPTADTINPESDESVTLTLVAGTGYNIGTPPSATGTITNVLPSPTTLAIAPTTANQTEGNSGTKPFTFTITRAGGLNGTTAVNWAVTGSGTNAANASDFGGTLPSGTVTFASGETSKTITVTVQGDTISELDETFTVTLSGPTGATITTATAIGTIINDDNDDTPTLSLGLSQNVVTEDGSQNLFYVFRRTGDVTNPLTVDFTVGGSATVGSDYVQRGATTFGGTTGSVTFRAGSEVVILPIDPSSDTVSDGNETVALTLTTGTGYTLGTTG
ncbi:MAG: calx-beta domain protein, partial [Cyanobacteria bacterium WB6_1B_304]|nr:calx-beta domain protein [Cyanobacteria bacterium WB6_1B_304]